MYAWMHVIFFSTEKEAAQDELYISLLYPGEEQLY